jgi:hypothetical protein
MEYEITKQEFKKLYFSNKRPPEQTGWTQDYWNHFFEYEKGKRYLLAPAFSPKATRMSISSGNGTHRVFFLTEAAEESLFDGLDFE